MKKIFVTLMLVFSVMLTFTGCDLDEDATPKEKVHSSKVEKQGKSKNANGTNKKSAEVKETKAEANARAAAEDYLDFMAFSRTGLIDQLKFDGFSQKDAEYGVDANKVDWNKQAAGSAQEYLDTMPFSKQGLIEQLKFDGFTAEQANYGANHVGL